MLLTFTISKIASLRLFRMERMSSLHYHMLSTKPYAMREMI